MTVYIVLVDRDCTLNSHTQLEKIFKTKEQADAYAYDLLKRFKLYEPIIEIKKFTVE